MASKLSARLILPLPYKRNYYVEIALIENSRILNPQNLTKAPFTWVIFVTQLDATFCCTMSNTKFQTRSKLLRHCGDKNSRGLHAQV